MVPCFDDFFPQKKQTTYDIDDNKDKDVIPDMLLKFPERNYIVDAKVSLTHWTKYINEKDGKIISFPFNWFHIANLILPYYLELERYRKKCSAKEMLRRRPKNCAKEILWRRIKCCGEARSKTII